MTAMTARWFRSHVERCLQEAYGEAECDEDGDYTLRRDTALWWVSVVGEEVLGVRVMAIAASISRATAPALREINDLNGFGSPKVYLNGRNAFVELYLPADGVSVSTLSYATAAVSGMAADVGPMLAAAFGGETPYPSELSDAAS
jgi:hypothetical protein